MKFIADVMLGRLARKLRLGGIDVLYDRTLTDNDIIRLAHETNRVILTRDTGLAKRPLAANHLFITSNHVEEQLRQVLAAYPLPLPESLTRCSLCNQPLSPVAKESVRDIVPDHVLDHHDAFLQCDGCGRVYWQGSHVARMGLATKKPARD